MKKRHPVKNNILLVNITRLGDMLQATPTIAGMKQENPNAKITVLVEKQFGEVCHHIPYIDEVVSLDLSMVVRSLARENDGIIDAYEYLSTVIEELRSQDFDYCLNMSSSAYTALLLNLVGIKNNGGWTADNEGFRKIESEWARLFAASVFHQNRQYNSLNLVDIFRCSADVEQHPERLLLDIQSDALEYAHDLVRSAQFENEGPLIAIQAGASQTKRQWDTRHFAHLIQILVDNLNARIVLIGSPKELPIIHVIVQLAQRSNILVSAGRTNIPQLAALLSLCDITVTGDTGPMHISVAVDTPVIAMFLASAYGFETGPYHAESIVLQPIIGCGPCNPNKACSKPECHDTMSPRLIASLVEKRLTGPVRQLPPELRNEARSVVIYRTIFDAHGFSDLVPLEGSVDDSYANIRGAYRRLWLEDLGGFEVQREEGIDRRIIPRLQSNPLPFERVVEKAREGQRLIDELIQCIKNINSPTSRLAQINERMTALDREIEDIGFEQGALGPLVRMFVFGKENLEGTDAVFLASQMGDVYADLERRSKKLDSYL
jgi:ADP-heptose:LPS heptosyltransferase